MSAKKSNVITNHQHKYPFEKEMNKRAVQVAKECVDFR